MQSTLTSAVSKHVTTTKSISSSYAGTSKAVRNHSDLLCMSVPQKYRQLGDFWRYYTGEKTAPVLTIVIGGNHEASNYFWELYHGGWLAPNIYFLGHAGCVQAIMNACRMITVP
ncbi:hypothetical protein EDC04DRAFT_492203 [Pisolithus marmoratus]|nr:hypothetical protein EDC04DRAFT_492203 [Pisolithus marmoratus]